MNKTRLVSLVVVALLCVALVLASTEAAAARATPKAPTVAKASASVSSAVGQGRAALHSGLVACRATAHDAAEWVRALPHCASRCASRTWSAVQRRAGEATRAVRASLKQVEVKASAVYQRVRTSVQGLAGRLDAAVPACVKPFVKDVVNGACSVIMVRQHYNAQAAGNIPDSPSSRSDAILSFTTAKFLYGLSAGTTEVLLLRLLYRQPHGNHRRNRWNQFLASPVGWPLMVALVAIPNGLVEAGMMLVMVMKLSPSSFRPAILLGHLIRPYAVAALRTCPYIQRAYRAYQSLWPAKAASTHTATVAVAEVLLWAVVVWAAMFLSAAMDKREEDEDTSMVEGSASDDEDEVISDTPVAAAKAAAKKPRAKASPAGTRKPRASPRSSSRR